MKNYFLLAMILLFTSKSLAVTLGTMDLQYCHIPNYSQEVLCGKQTVYEDRVAASGRQIDIQFAIVPSVTEAKEPDPLIIFAGGPGQGAREIGPYISMAFSEIRENRDIILIDQRGMGASAPLSCDEPDTDMLTMTEQQQVQLTRELLKKCLADLDADVTKYTQDIANQDIHEILQSLGYEKVNLYGVSWGTRSTLLYATQFPEQVRSIIQDGNAPVDNKIPLYAADDAEQSMQAIFRDCSNNTDCNKAFPDLENDFNTLLNSFGETGKQATVADANTGINESFILTRNVFVNALRSVLYSPEYSRLIPLIIEQAKNDNYQTLAALTAAFGDGGMAIGATLTILCSEDLARISDAEIKSNSSNSFLGEAFVNNFKNSCAVWPKAPLPEIYNQSLISDVPTLILSGDIDPVTPPRWGDRMAHYMPNSKHLIAANTGHNVAPVGCTSELMAQFVNQASIDDIDDSCLQTIKRPSFFIDASGPVRSMNND